MGPGHDFDVWDEHLGRVQTWTDLRQAAALRPIFSFIRRTVLPEHCYHDTRSPLHVVKSG